MISDRSLALAVDRGVLTPDQASTLREIERSQTAAAVEDEQIRFVAGFGDVFVCIGLLLFLGSTAYFAYVVAGAMACAGSVAGLSWALAEFFIRRRRMPLPGIVLVQTFAAGVFAFAVLAGAYAFGLAEGLRPTLAWLRPDAGYAGVVIMAALTAALAIAVHYARFRVPIAVASGVLALLVASTAALVRFAPEFTLAWSRALLFAYGVAVFALAMRFDLADRRRATRLTDIAFWLHFLAAPLIVQSLVGAMIGSGRSFDAGTALSVLGTFLLLGLVAVLIDRRALLVAGLAYAGVACAALLQKTGFGGITVPATLLLLGAFILLLSAGWQRLRHVLLRLLPIARLRPTP